MVFLRSTTRYHPPSNYVERECLVAQQRECHLFPAIYPIIPKQMRLQFLFSFPSSEIGLCIWDNVFFFAIPFDEVVHTKHTFPTTSTMHEHFNSLKIRGNVSFGSHYLRFWPVLHHGWHFLTITSPRISHLTGKSCCTGAVITTLNKNVLYFSKYLGTHPLIGSREKTM